MTFAPLEAEGVSAHYDTDKQITFVTYTGELTASQTSALYNWVGQLIAEIGEDATRGVIFDFREVTDFHKSNLPATNRYSREVNLKHNNTAHPVALIVKTMYQESMVRITARLAGDEWRKKIVHSPEEALQYVDDWHSARETDA